MHNLNSLKIVDENIKKYFEMIEEHQKSNVCTGQSCEECEKIKGWIKAEEAIRDRD